MAVTLKNNGDALIISAADPLTIYTVREFHKAFCSVLKEGKNAVIDASRIIDIDTCGAELLLHFKSAMNKNKLSLTITGHTPEIVKHFDLYGLLGFFGDPVKVPLKLKNELNLSYGLKRRNGESDEY